MKRPLGVTILAILAIIGGILAIIGSLLLFLAGGAIAGGAAATGTTHLSATVVLTQAVVALILGILDLVWGVGALRLRPWAWMLGIGLGILYILSLVLNIVLTGGVTTGDIVSAVISVIIIAYLFTPGVRRAFGRG
jgi:uncharacterized membrane protein (DUF2068 family)